ncbi:uncharacterized protein BCR38DRAFT_54264 [Pseudomassariella vexata]|uniref:Uncharacterized protein n=1 Tax=Pseudomassariella vexata TaxID=1141098 RepID=A0A1Y2DLV9_9PEZI|nr:uncharacterized protein BCR38DRAFT_54264 [Pseudomassariella vexata]ORY60126.1 hypothetical protein BCR38DRAFT_54264 [Pseudomassariella vexata]
MRIICCQWQLCWRCSGPHSLCKSIIYPLHNPRVAQKRIFLFLMNLGSVGFQFRGANPERLGRSTGVSAGCPRDAIWGRFVPSVLCHCRRLEEYWLPSLPGTSDASSPLLICGSHSADICYGIPWELVGPMGIKLNIVANIGFYARALLKSGSTSPRIHSCIISADISDHHQKRGA